MEETVSTPVCYRHPDRPTRLACTQCGRPICVECSHDAAVGQRCPDHAGSPGRHRVIDARRTTGRGTGLAGAPFVKWTLVVTIGIFVVSWLSDLASSRGISELTIRLYDNLAHYNRSIADGQIWRLATSALLHSPQSIWHIGFNMWALYVFGPELERRVGTIPFASLYLTSAVAGGTAVFALRDNAVAVGASGALFGLFGAWLYVSWRMRGTIRGREQFRTLAVLLALNLALPFLAPGLNIAWEAHVGGLIGGTIVAWGWSTFAVGSRHPERRRTLFAAGVLLISLGIVLIL